MGIPFNAVRGGHDRITIQTVHLAFVLSLLLHALALWGWLPKVPMLPFDDTKLGRPSGALAVRLAPRPEPAPPPVPLVQAQPAPAPAHRSPSPKAAPRPPAAPRILALERPSSTAATPRPAEAAPPSSAGDLASYVEARRRSRPSEPEPSPQPAESEQERHNRVAAANLGLDRAASFGAERKPGGGVFQIERIGYDDAEFFFYGWNKQIRRNARQMISVRRGDNPSIELAVVRRMIAIIREQSSGDFVWESPRLGRDVTLSARPSDNAGLEDFMMLEFFSSRRPR
jgi:hypothetical protein